MIDVIKQSEEVPASYPDAPAGLSSAAAALDADMIWARIERYTAYRFSERDVVWVIEGTAGATWSPPLAPIVSQMAEFWMDDAWEPITLLDAPIGICLQGAGFYRITAQIGAGPVPAAVEQAFRRLAEYMAGGRSTINEPGASSYSFNLGDGLQWDVAKNPAWMARAMQNSGAADLLRPYRRA